MDAILILFLLAGFFAAMAFIVLLGARASHKSDFAWEPIHPNPIPYRRRNFLFSSAERSFYQVLRSLVPDHMIFVKVKLADLVTVKSHDRSFWEYFSPFNRKHIDFVVCDPTLAPVVAIQLAHALPSRGEVSSRDELLTSVLAGASLPIVRVPERRRYQLGDLRNLLAPYLRVPAPMI